MGAVEFGRLMGRAMAEQGVSQNRLASRLGELPDGRVFDATQIRLLREGRRRLDHELVGRIIDLLHLPEEEAWHAAGLWPPDLDVQAYRRYRSHLAAVGATSDQPRPKSGRTWRRPGERRWADRRHVYVSGYNWDVVAAVEGIPDPLKEAR